MGDARVRVKEKLETRALFRRFKCTNSIMEKTRDKRWKNSRQELFFRRALFRRLNLLAAAGRHARGSLGHARHRRGAPRAGHQ